MANIVIIGGQWGDEGKGKVIDFFSEDFDIIARFQGGHNAGHTVKTEKEKFILHILPTGIIRSGKQCVIGNGVVINPHNLIGELEKLEKCGIDINGRLFISNRAHLIMPYHSILDNKNEAKSESKKIGTTGRGIGPAYSSKMSRTGIRIADLADAELFREKLESSIEEYRDRGHKDRVDIETIYRDYLDFGKRFENCFLDVSIFLDEAIKKGKKILFEGAQGTLLDVDHGTYPYVTSSNTIAGGACVGLGVGPTKIDKVIGIVKAYATRVGNGPFPSEVGGETGRMFRDSGEEYGSTTGRPRRCGWLDLPALRYAIRINGFDSIVLTKLDVLDFFDKIKVCRAYKWRGKVIDHFPAELNILNECEPVYEIVEGWGEKTSDITEYDSLPSNARQYVERLENWLDIKISIVSVGSRRSQTIVRENPLFSDV